MEAKIRVTFNGGFDFTDAIKESINQIPRTQNEHNEKALEKILRDKAIPPIKGEITKGKMKYRGINIKQIKESGEIKLVVYQRNKKIGEILQGFYIEIKND